jgi:hypothetical protein
VHVRHRRVLGLTHDLGGEVPQIEGQISAQRQDPSCMHHTPQTVLYKLISSHVAILVGLCFFLPHDESQLRRYQQRQEHS